MKYLTQEVLRMLPIMTSKLFGLILNKKKGFWTEDIIVVRLFGPEPIFCYMLYL